MSFIKVLMVAEKPSIADALARSLSGGRSIKGDSRIPVHEYRGNFLGQDAVFFVTSVMGHVFSIDFESKWNRNWDEINPEDLYGAGVVSTEANPKARVVDHLSREARGAHVICLWLDCDREGENICFEVLRVCEPVMAPHPRGLKAQRIFRAKFSSLVPEDLRKAMVNLGVPNANEARAVDARQEIDLKVGCSFTRFQTQFFRGRFSGLNSALVSYGPCQTPTLGFCVARADEITRFVSEPYWTLQATVNMRGWSGTLDYVKGRFMKEADARKVYTSIEKLRAGKITLVKKKREFDPPPAALNTVEMLKMASKILGMGAHQTMHTAEYLYTSGYISYPRTESSRYPDAFEFRPLLEVQASHPQWGSAARDVLASKSISPTNTHVGIDAGDHPPITPVAMCAAGDVGGDASRLYELITRHFIATLSPAASWLRTTVHVDIGGEEFSVGGRSDVKLGWLAVVTYGGGKVELHLPALEEGADAAVQGVNITKKMTEPPEMLSESDLITLMEQHKIGTDASIATHINNIQERNYVRCEAGRRLVPTKLGMALCHGYHRIDPDLVLPSVRAQIELDCTAIAEGKQSFADVVQRSLGVFRSKFSNFVASIALMDELFEASFTQMQSSQSRALSRCGRCRRYLQFVSVKPQRMYCPTCEDAWSLPQGVLVKGGDASARCPLCDFELIICQTQTRVPKSYTLCPHCYNNPPFEELHGQAMTCGRCPVENCKFSMANIGICACAQCDGQGMLIIDGSTGGAGIWRIICNSCPAVFTLQPERKILRLSVVPKVQWGGCENCGSSLVSVETSKDYEFPFGGHQYEGCIICDELLVHMLQDSCGGAVRGRGGRGRGGGRGRARARGKRGSH